MKKRPAPKQVKQQDLDELISALKGDGFTLELLDMCGGCACMIVRDDATGGQIRLTAMPAPEPPRSLRSLH